MFLEAWFHAGSLDFPQDVIDRIRDLAAHVPVVLDVTLDRPAVLTPLLPVASVLTATFGTSDEAFVDALTGVVTPRGHLPFDLPWSMDDVRAHPEDMPGLEDPLFPAGHGLRRRS